MAYNATGWMPDMLVVECIQYGCDVVSVPGTGILMLEL